MASKAKAKKIEDEDEDKGELPMILTESEVAALSEDQKQEFRAKGGTSTPDPK